MSEDGEQSHGLGRWLGCPACGSDDVTHGYNNGRFSLACEDCHEGTSKLVGMAKFR